MSVSDSRSLLPEGMRRTGKLKLAFKQVSGLPRSLAETRWTALQHPAKYRYLDGFSSVAAHATLRPVLAC